MKVYLIFVLGIVTGCVLCKIKREIGLYMLREKVKRELGECIERLVNKIAKDMEEKDEDK